MKTIYLDYGATSPVREEALQAMLPYFREKYGNSGSIHDFGQVSREAIEHARRQVAEAIDADSPREIIFVGSGTEANNLALIGAARKHRNKGNHIITSSIEHPSVLEACRQLEREGFEVTYLPVDRFGLVRSEDVKKALTDKTILVSIMAANNEVGTIQPIAEISRLLKRSSILFHTDAVQYFGKVPMSVADLGVDLLSIGSHKIGGPKGIGALYIRKGVRIEPLFHGGGQERGLRPSTLNTPAIVGFGAAAYLAAQEAEAESARLTRLRDACWQRIRDEIGEVVLNGHPTRRLPNNLNLSFHRVEGQAVLLELSRNKIYVSSGSACSAGKHAASHVLMAMGTDEETAFQSLRITFGKETTEAELQRFITCLKKVMDELRSLLINES
ncbi:MULTISPECIES: cysteine desulfurase family protein [Thermoactinomyces]|jgi:cysteine desulfurase|uniref:cysteine desulfurase n=1 Tax=Thermoactinomyces daqus TaxID=1329516 RepID=A0A7W2AJS5_9BACL|nr:MULTISPECIES: cysteine desulfurase family protein [Thermoactinomyces]MBA4544168.1 cysteine desulfurase [Thermoactinomyces daqus]MBH8597056.1 cysteine desulfurase [Thermoactinomyces sp. CICC 10523]MBH8602615.1 cysteine desulfurase [Thermoactinomyces sp. CICC 10522]MBH8606273.1 cysteine desulfurase [Thermoactinomyces sp. CICC 10521]